MPHSKNNMTRNPPGTRGKDGRHSGNRKSTEKRGDMKEWNRVKTIN